MEIIIPELKSKETIEFIKRLHNFDTSYGMDVKFKYQANWVDPLGMILCSSAIKHFRQDHNDLRMALNISNTDSYKYAGHMGFFKNISTSIEVGKSPGEASGNDNYVPITHINLNELHKKEIENGNYGEMNDTIESESKRLAKVLCRSNKELQKLFSYIIREILRNIPEHSNSNLATICAQYLNNGKAEIAILDEGIGIKNSLIKNKIHSQYIISDQDALEAAIRPGISQAFSPDKKNNLNDVWSNSGYGLFIASEICKRLDGEFWIVSGSKALKVDKSGKTVYDTYFSGTAIGISFYAKSLNNSQKMITDISKQGEEQAKTIREAFKKASEPSKSLIIK